jgi:signal transduction histidine kinase
MRTAPPRKPPAFSQNEDHGAASLDEQLARLTQQLDSLKAQVRQAQQLASLGTASAMIAHETSNLLTPILSYADYALGQSDPELMKKALSVTLKNAKILVQMSERVLEISSAGPPQRGAVCVRQAVQDALTSLCRDLGKDGITVTIQVPESLTVLADALQLQQVLFNLLLNAREAMAPAHSGRLTISAGAATDGEVGESSLSEGIRGSGSVDDGAKASPAPLQGARVWIRVHNTGPAIPPEVLPHIFDPLQTTKPAARDGKRRCGGLGLALCRDLVEENGGTISVVSSAEAGTTFTISLSELPGARKA